MPFGRGRVEGAAMAASLESLRNDRIGPCLLGAERFRKRRGSGKPADTLCLEAFDKSGGKSPMIEETARGFAARRAAHCAAKSGGAASPACTETSGPQAGLFLPPRYRGRLAGPEPKD